MIFAVYFRAIPKYKKVKYLYPTDQNNNYEKHNASTRLSFLFSDTSIFSTKHACKRKQQRHGMLRYEKRQNGVHKERQGNTYERANDHERHDRDARWQLQNEKREDRKTERRPVL